MTDEEVKDCFRRQEPVMYKGRSYPVVAVTMRRAMCDTMFFKRGEIIMQAELDDNGCTLIAAPRDLELRKY